MIENGKDVTVCVAQPRCGVTVSFNISLGSAVIAAGLLAHVPKKQAVSEKYGFHGNRGWESAAHWNLLSKKCCFQGVKTGFLCRRTSKT